MGLVLLGKYVLKSNPRTSWCRCRHQASPPEPSLLPRLWLQQERIYRAPFTRRLSTVSVTAVHFTLLVAGTNHLVSDSLPVAFQVLLLTATVIDDWKGGDVPIAKAITRCERKYHKYNIASLSIVTWRQHALRSSRYQPISEEYRITQASLQLPNLAHSGRDAEIQKTQVELLFRFPSLQSSTETS